MTDADGPIIVEQRFPVSSASAWKAITDRDEMVQWFFNNIPEFSAEVGFHTEFDVNTGERNFRHLWTITEVVPGEKIVYDWRYAEYSGTGKVTFEVLPDGDGSIVRVTSEGLETFPKDVPEFTREAGVGGWTYFIQGTLKEYLDV